MYKYLEVCGYQPEVSSSREALSKIVETGRHHDLEQGSLNPGR